MSRFTKILSAAVLGVSMMATASFSVHAATQVEDLCLHEHIVEVGTEIVSMHYVNTSEHSMDVRTVSMCELCQMIFYSGIYHVTEPHDYYLDYDTNMLICTGCGDSYSYTK